MNPVPHLALHSIWCVPDSVDTFMKGTKSSCSKMRGSSRFNCREGWTESFFLISWVLWFRICFYGCQYSSLPRGPWSIVELPQYKTNSTMQNKTRELFITLRYWSACEMFLRVPWFIIFNVLHLVPHLTDHWLQALVLFSQARDILCMRTTRFTFNLLIQSIPLKFNTLTRYSIWTAAFSTNRVKIPEREKIIQLCHSSTRKLSISCKVMVVVIIYSFFIYLVEPIEAYIIIGNILVKSLEPISQKF